MVDSERYPKLVHCGTRNTIEINANPFTIGRGLGCNYVIPSKVISRMHCTLEKEGDSWFVTDSSTNGTYVDGRLIKSTRSSPLYDNTLISLDLVDFTYTFHLPRNDSMDDISDEQLCQFADSILNDVQTFQGPRHEDTEAPEAVVPNVAPTHPLHDHLGMAKSQDEHINKKPKLDAPTSTSKIIDLTNTSTNTEESLALQPGPSTDNERPSDDAPAEESNDKDSQSEPETLKDTVQDKYEVMENELQCPVCAELFIKAVTLGCAHTFCKYCIELWKKTKSECPICRTQITSMTATLVLDNVVEKVVEGSSEGVKQHRKEVVAEREKAVEEERAPRRTDIIVNGRSRRGRRRVTNARRNTANNPRSTIVLFCQV